VQDLPKMQAALKRTGRVATELAAYPIPRCADPKGYWPRILALLQAAGDNARSGSGLAEIMMAVAPLREVKSFESKLGAELKKTTRAQAGPPAPAHSAAQSQAAEPTFAYPGARQCAITYRDNHNGTMSWTAKVTTRGQLITHASSKAGNIYRHVIEVTPGLATFTAPVPLSQVNDIGGVLYGKKTSYGCSIAPKR
jgi:hypothetical protein